MIFFLKNANTIELALRKILQFYLISWCGNFVEKHCFRIVSTPRNQVKLRDFLQCRGQDNNLFHSYLTNRAQFTSVNRFNARPYLTSHGIPQGSVLDPLLFIIFINDPKKSMRRSQMLQFADNTNLPYINQFIKRYKNTLRI